MSHLKYLHLTPDSELPALEGLRQFKAIIIAEAEVHETMMWDISRWLIAEGCQYALAWGKDAEAWREAIDDAALEAVNYEDIPDEQKVLITSHEDDDLDEVFWFARHRAAHPAHELQQTLILHIADAPRREEIEAEYHDA
ncbi:DUF7684 family protein [Duganella callida]|uniref:DUF7684 domain-containing protein n=1 Tax=Duganella callida TaxID=2561932 RepID=A0A4Y9S4T6_9BURK|nr:hypothetical protein [Duganella callida]TFW16344.1 hypothetical protein E4L98_24070 [Duganella callida]